MASGCRVRNAPAAAAARKAPFVASILCALYLFFLPGAAPVAGARWGVGWHMFTLPAVILRLSLRGQRYT